MRRITAAAVLTAALLQPGTEAAERLTTRGGQAVVIQPLVHASVRIDFSSTIVYVDPWSRAIAADAPAADVILVTDADAGAHHLDTAAIRRLRKDTTAIVIPASGSAQLPDGIVMANGEQRTFGAVHVQAIESYDLLPGDPFHARGVANGYVVGVDGVRLLFAGVTECVPGLKALQAIDVAFLPMNLPHGRMTVDAVAACLAALKPKVVYPYHYDQGYIARLSGRRSPVDAAAAERSVRMLADKLTGRVEVRTAEWYPVK